MLRTLACFALVLAACGSEPPPIVPPSCLDAPDLSVAYADPACPITKPAMPDRLDEALTHIGIDRCRLGYTKFDREIFIPDEFRMPWFDAVHANAMRAPAFARGILDRLDEAADSDTRLSRALSVAAESYAPEALGCLTPLAVDPEQPLARAIERVILEEGGTPDRAALELDAADVPLPLQRDLAAVVLAAAEANTHFRTLLAAFTPEEIDELSRLQALSLRAVYAGPVLSEEVMDLLAHRLDLGDIAYGAIRLAARLDAVNLRSHAGAAGFSFDQATPIGRVVLRDRADDTYPADGAPVLVLLDTGGNDHYLFPAGAVDHGLDATDARHVGIAIDLQGRDIYGYHGIPDDADGDVGRLISDGQGRYHTRFDPKTDDGPVSLSEIPRQGAARLGYGFLLDLGTENDTYSSLRMSQGYGTVGVGVLYDVGGDDQYEAEAISQGAGNFGLGLLIDDAGNDVYQAYVQTQGFGFVRGIGVLYDARGDDQYLANSGDPAFGGDPLYLSAQIPGNANDSFAQGAGFGRRDDAGGAYMSGGLGVLRDRAGNDVYRAAVYAQSSGYWYGTGILGDAAGDDQYDGRYYVQSAGAHWGLSVFLDDAGSDRYNQVYTPKATSIGIGHDFSVAWHIDGGGNDVYRGPYLSLGGGNVNGIGVLLNLGGDDVYVSAGEPTLGVGNLSSEVNTWAARRARPTVGLFLDVGGADRYEVTSTVVRGDDTPWINNREPADGGATTEHGGGIDTATGEVRLP